MKPIHVFTGTPKIVVQRDHYGQWWQTTQGCVQCGKCCSDMKNAHFPGAENWVQEDGVCKFLWPVPNQEGKYQCLLYPAQPFGTCTCTSPENVPEYCSMEFEKITEDEALEIIRQL